MNIHKQRLTAAAPYHALVELHISAMATHSSYIITLQIISPIIICYSMQAINKKTIPTKIFCVVVGIHERRRGFVPFRISLS